MKMVTRQEREQQLTEEVEATAEIRNSSKRYSKDLGNINRSFARGWLVA